MALSVEFIAVFLVAIYFYFPEELDSDLKPRDTAQDDVKKSYDFIIVGGGSAGCVVANRLSENPEWSVLLIEAGGDENYISDTPLLAFSLYGSSMAWNYTTVNQTKTCLSADGSCPYSRGHVLGGSSTINGMLYVRGNREDYDAWASAGNIGWSYEDVLPYFIKSENMTEKTLASSPYHGTRGYLKVAYPVYTVPIAKTLIKAGEELGWKKGDYNGKNQNVIDYIQFTLDGPTRDSTSRAFLNPIRNRKNLFIIKNSRATKVLFDGGIANGVEYYRGGQLHEVEAKKEVILCAGVIETPKLLMLSGIGPKEELMKHGIAVINDLPVGQNFQDHIFLKLTFSVNHLETATVDYASNQSIYEYAEYRDGPLTAPGIDIVSFFNTFDKSLPPNFQITSLSFNLNEHTVPIKNTLSLIGAMVAPKSVGSVQLKSSNWTDPPLIDPNCFAERSDFQVMRQGMKKIFAFMRTRKMSRLSPELRAESYSKCRQNDTDMFIDCAITEYGSPAYHAIGTARMGPVCDDTAVVTPDLRVIGVQRLSVVDASVMPAIPQGNTNAPTIMIAEKGSDLIKARYSTSTDQGLGPQPWYQSYTFVHVFYCWSFSFF